ncbi:MAG: hypothetical protein IPP88_07775 [Betaproteobacteria bacterium]|nr:hypothetical protein [Betaproteobacteria bacterium]
MRARFLFSAVAISAAALSVQAQTGIAFITDVKGEAGLDAGKASLMAEIKKGARINCVRECAVGVMYLLSGKEYVLKGPGDFLVGDDEVTAKIGAPPTVRETKWKVSSQVVAQASQASSASIRMRSLGSAKAEVSMPAERLLYPRDTNVATLQPAFRWTSANAKGPFEFELKASGSAKPLYKAKAGSMNVNLPGNIKLQPDLEYSWAVKSGATYIGMTSFKTLPTSAIDLAQKRKPDEKAAFSDWLLYGLTLKEVGADQDASEVWGRLAKDRPDLPELAALAR